MASPIIGLYLGTESADFVEFTGSFQHPHLVSFGRVQLPAQGAWRTQVRAEETSPAPTGSGETPPTAGGTVEEVAHCIQALFQKGKLSASARIHVALASEAVLIRYFQMPLIPVHERKLAVSFEAKKYLPFKLEELVTGFQVVVRHSDPSLMRVMFYGIKKDSLAAVVSLFKSAGIHPRAIEPAPVCLMRLLRQSGELATDQVAVVLCVERDSATITIARNDLLYLTRNVTVVGTPTTGGPSTELLEALTNETRVSIDYYRRRFLGEPAVSKVILFAKDLSQKRVEEVAAGLDIPVQLGDPFKRIGGSKDAPPGLAVAAGLALRGFEKVSGEADLLPPELRRESENIKKSLIVQAIAAVSILAIWTGVSLFDIGQLQGRLATLTQQQIRPTGVIPTASLKDLQLLRDQTDKELQFLRQLSKFHGESSTLLAACARLLPEEAWLRYVYLEDTIKSDRPGSLSILRRRLLRCAGGSFLDDRGRELEGVNNFLGSLRSDPLYTSAFTQFNLDSVQRSRVEEEETTEFRLTCAGAAEDLKRAPAWGRQ